MIEYFVALIFLWFTSGMISYWLYEKYIFQNMPLHIKVMHVVYGLASLIMTSVLIIIFKVSKKWQFQKK